MAVVDLPPCLVGPYDAEVGRVYGHRAEPVAPSYGAGHTTMSSQAVLRQSNSSIANTFEDVVAARSRSLGKTVVPSMYCQSASWCPNADPRVLKVE